MKLNHASLLTAAIVFGLVLTAGLMFMSFHYLVQAQQDGFDEQSKHMANIMASELEQVREDIRVLATAFYALDNINADTLQANSEGRLKPHRTVSRLLYAPNIADKQRNTFEIKKRDEGFITFTIQDFYDNKLQRASKRPTYLPITQVEPFDVDNVSLLGLDLLGVGSFKNALNQSIKSGDDVALIASLGEEEKALWLFKAIYSGFAGRFDPYFAAHSNEMVNGMVAIKADVSKFIAVNALPAQITMQLAVKDKESDLNSAILFESNPVETTSIWSGMKFSKRFVLPLTQQDIVIYTSRTLPWFHQVFLLFFLSGIIGLGFTCLLVFATRNVQESERRNRAILGSAMDAIISIDEHAIIKEFNPAAERIFGHQSSDVIGKDIVDLIIPADKQQQLKQGVAHYLKTGQQHVLDKQLEMNLLRSNGDAFPVELNIVKVLAGKHRQFTAFLRDISARRQAQNELERLATVVEQSFNAIIITDTKGLVQYVNPAFETLSGYDAKEVLGQLPSIVKSGEHSDQYYTSMWQTITSGNTWSGSFINKAKDGHMYHVEQTIFPLHIGDEHVGYTSVQQDVTERDRLQEQSEHTQRLESLGVLAGGIAHDFNNLLTAIMGNAGLAQNKLPDASPAHKHLHNIQQASESAASLCQQMLAYSGKGHFIIRPLNLSSTIADIVQLLESSIAKLAKLDVQLDYSLPAIHADEGQIKQVIMNLVINASEAIGDHSGKIGVKTSQTRLDKTAISTLLGAEDMLAGDYVHLQVCDDGCGMSEDIRKKIFDPFFTTKFTGRGLGMSAILGIIRGHHGGLKVSSTLAEGTQFDVYFPASEHVVRQEVASSDKVESTQQRAGTVLVIDDEETVRELAMMILQDAGLKVMAAVDGLEGLELLREHQACIDLVLLDMTMPRMGGEEFYKQMSLFAPDKHVIISSGYAEQEIRGRFDKSAMIDFVQKPYHPEKLIEKVKVLLS